jgi:hypothetical protein
MPPPAPIPPPIGIGIIPIPLPVGPAAAAISAALGMPPSPDIAELIIREGIEPCQVGGTDIAPTNRALPKSAAIPAPRPPAPPNGFMSGIALPTNFAGSAANAAALAAAIPAVFDDELAICTRLISGEIAMLAGYIPIWATDVNGCNPEAADSTVDSADIAAGAAAVTACTTGARAVMIFEPSWDNTVVAPSCDTKPDNPVMLIGGKLNCAIVEATDVAPA